MRNFDPHIEALSAVWRRDPVSDGTWTLRPDLGNLSGAAGSYWVSASGIVGVAKPRQPNAVPFAALEKIASDLACDLALPIPPVVLWDRGTVPSGEERYVAISAVPFAQPKTWGEFTGHPALAALVTATRPRLSIPLSAMCAFDTWLHNTDHGNHAGNLLISIGADANQTLHLAYIDYSFSMAHSWPNGGEWTIPFCTKLYDPTVPPDPASTHRTLDAINDLPEAAIRDVVDRVPSGWLSASQKARIADGLLVRRSHLRAILIATYPALAQP